jgi:hypothetical protein
MRMNQTTRTVAVALGALLVAAGTTLAQSAPSPGSAVEINTGNPARDTLTRLGRRVTIKLEEERLEDVLRFIQEYTGAEFEIMWTDERNTEGLDPDQTVTLEVKNQPTLNLLERVLDEVQNDFDGNTWQFSKYGNFQVGPKARLGRPNNRRIEIYDIHDLIMDLPDYEDVPDIDLQQSLQQSQGGRGGGGGGGQSPFRNTQQNDENENRRTIEERANEVVDIITALVEPEQWIDNGGESATIRLWNGTVIVNAPDFVHRQINGYRWYPSRLQSSRVVKGRRYVGLSIDTGISKIDGFAQAPVSAVVGGQIVRSNDPGGGG